MTDRDDRSLIQRIDEEMVVSKDAELARLRRETQALADACHEDAPATGGYLDGVADDFDEARAMLARTDPEDSER